MDGGDGHAGTKRRYPLEHLPLANRYGPRRTTRPGTCTLVDDLRRDVRGHGSMWARAARTARPIGLDEGFASALASLRRRQRRAAHRRTPRNARAQCNGRWRCARRFEDALSVELQLSTDRSTLAHSPRCSRSCTSNASTATPAASDATRGAHARKIPVRRRRRPRCAAHR